MRETTSSSFDLPKLIGKWPPALVGED